MRSHGVAPRGLSARVTQSPLPEGRFGRMFRRLDPAPPLPERELKALARKMRGRAAGAGDNPEIPAGYTYFGQFVDHDVTFDPQSRLERENDPDALVDFRTPRFDLDSVYGSGPDDEPFQYARGTQGMRMLIESNGRGDDDLPRNSEGVALIGDPRNDENAIVGQLHLLFLKFHNKVAAQVAAAAEVQESERFEETRRRVRWTYQRIVVDDYLPRVCGREAVDRVWTLHPRTGARTIETRFYKPANRPYMPVEFSGAAFRFGHSQVRGTYELSGAAGTHPVFVPGALADPFQDLRGFRRLPAHWTIDWSRFFPIGGSVPQPSRAIDAKLSPALFDLPDSGGSLALRNLRRGQALGLPSGQDVAGAAEIPALSGAELGAPEKTPLWFYVLKESELAAGGRHLGPVGALIVSEVLLGLLRGDSQSFYNRQPGWQATEVIPDADGDGIVGMGDLAAFVGA